MKYRILLIISILSINLCGMTLASDVDLFAKARAAVASTQLDARFLSGIEAAEKLVQARLGTLVADQKLPQLQSLFSELVANFPTAPSELKNIQGPLSWDEYQAAVEKLIDWKAPQDVYTPNHGYFERMEAPLPVNLRWLPASKTPVYRGFIPEAHGIIGEAIILICLANDVSPHGFPLAFSDIVADKRNMHTGRFVEHDKDHNRLFINKELKRKWILSGELKRLLQKVPFTSEFVVYMFDLMWESGDYLVKSSDAVQDALGAGYTCTYDYMPEIYLYLFGPNPLGSRDELRQAIISFMTSFYVTWEELPILLKHFSSLEELQDILQHRKEPRSELVRKMKQWGFVYNLPDFEPQAVPTVHWANFLNDLLFYLDKKGHPIWPILDVAGWKGELAHEPNASPYELRKLVESTLQKAEENGSKAK